MGTGKKHIHITSILFQKTDLHSSCAKIPSDQNSKSFFNCGTERGDDQIANIAKRHPVMVFK